MTRRLYVVALIGVGLAPATLATEATPSKQKGAAAVAPSMSEAARPGPEAEETYAVLQAPLFSDAFAATPVAKVEDQVITLRELTDAIAGAHGQGHGEPAKAGKKDFTPILDRLIDARLMVYEAREMGIDELPEYKEAREKFRTSAAQEILKEQVTAGIEADPVETDRIYKDTVREWKVASVVLDRADYAKEITAQLKAGKTFEAAVERIVAEKKGKAGGPAEFLPRAKMLMQVVQALTFTKVGEVSPPVRVQDGFAVMKVEDVRYPEDPKARAEAESLARVNSKKAALTKYYAGAVERYAKVDKGLLERLDYHARKPGFAALEKDQRVIARIKGGKPLTVADLTAALKEGFFHGVEGALKEKKINKQKYPVFDGLLSQRILPLEVERERIMDGPEFARRLTAWESTMLFSQVIQRVVLPEVKVGEPEQRRYYEAHKAEYQTPAMYRLESLVFRSAKEAQGAVDQLRAGTDFKWLNANAEGQVDAKSRVLRLEGVLAATTLPPDVAKALAGTKKGDLRLYQEPETSFFHSIRVVDVVPAGQQPFEEIAGVMQQKVFGEGVGEGVKAFAAKLRKERNVKVYLTRIGG